MVAIALKPLHGLDHSALQEVRKRGVVIRLGIRAELRKRICPRLVRAAWVAVLARWSAVAWVGGMVRIRGVGGVEWWPRGG